MGQMAFCTVNGLVLHYRITGAGTGRPWLVLVNSLGTDLRIWEGVVERLGDRFAILAYDKRGHGLSGLGAPPYAIADHADDLFGLLTHLDIAAPILCGVSVGGQVAMEAALCAPERFSGLVLSNTAARIGSAEFWADRIATIAAGGIEAQADGIIARWFSPDFAASHPETVEGYRAMLVRQPLEGYLGTCAGLRDFDRRADLGTISLPTAVISGGLDGATPPDLVEETCRAIPGASYHPIEKAGHLPGIEMPDEVAAVIVQLAARATEEKGTRR